jgi:PD-(D/E)XK nuclease superfamily
MNAPLRTSVSLPLLTHSSLTAARACLRLYRNRYVLGLRSLVGRDEAPELGDLVHVGLEHWWLNAGDIVGAIRVARAHAAANKIDAFQLARAEALLIGYHARWIDDVDKYEGIAVETEFRAPLTNPVTGAESRTYRLGGKLDVLVLERATGRKLIVEHKTSGEDISPGSFYWLRRHMDSQVSIYFDGARALGHDVQGCIYDVLAKPELRPSQVPVLDTAAPEDQQKIVVDAGGQRVRTKDGKKWRQTGDTAAGYVVQTRAETPEEFRARLIDKICDDPEAFFVRAEVARDGQDLDEAARDRWQLGTMLRDATRTETWPRNPDACMRFNRPCEFLEACAGRADLNDRFLYRRAESPHPELAGPASVPSREETAA